MSRLARIAGLILPLAGLAGLWALSDHTYRQGTEWEVPIQGYDPRDYLRGHYLEFSYDWPGIDEFRDVPPQMLCLEGDAPKLAKVTGYERVSEGRSCTHPLRADRTGAYGWNALVRGRLYLDQNRAAALQQELRDDDQRGIVTIRQREDGSFTPIAIRFHPLTAAEKAERDAQRDAPFVPPPIMIAPSENPRP